MVKDHSDSERKPAAATWDTLSTDMIALTTAFVKLVVEHTFEREIAQRVHHEGSIRRTIAPSANAPTTELHLDPYVYVRRPES